MIDPITNRAYQEYSRTQKPKTENVNGEKFSMDPSMSGNHNGRESDGVIYESSVNKEEDTKSGASGSGLKRQAASDAADFLKKEIGPKEAEEARTPSASFFTNVSAFFKNLLSQIGSFLKSVWESPSDSQNTEKNEQSPADSKNIVKEELLRDAEELSSSTETSLDSSEEDSYADGIALDANGNPIGLSDNAGSTEVLEEKEEAKSYDELSDVDLAAMELEAIINGTPLPSKTSKTSVTREYKPESRPTPGRVSSTDARLDENIKSALRKGDTDTFNTLITQGGTRTPARSTSLLTYYDSRGRIVDMDPSNEWRILHGDRRSRKS